MTLAAVSIREPVLDYTKVTTPLTPDAVLEDIHSVFAERALQPDEIKMWEYQWDWLVKNIPEWREDEYLYGGSGRFLWGVPVTLVEQPRPVAVLQVNSPLTDEEAEEIRNRFEALQPTGVASIRAEQQSIIDRIKEKVGK